MLASRIATLTVMDEPVGGSMAAIMAAGDQMLDNWVEHAQRHTASSPELVAHMMMAMEETPNKTSVLAVLAASAIQRLAHGR